MIQPTIKIKGKTNASIIKMYPELENLRVVPTREGQRFKSVKYGFDEVTVEGYIPKLQEKTVEPKVYEQEVNVDSEFDGLSRVNVGKVTSAIDENIKPENIVNGINILGVEGTLADTSDATAIAGDILKDKTAYVGNKKITGTIEDYANNEILITDKNGAILNTSNKYCKEDITVKVQTEPIDIKPKKEEQNFEGLYESITVSGDPNLTPENIKIGTSIFDVEGTLADTSDATATEADILKGKDAYVNNRKITGTVENYENSEVLITDKNGTTLQTANKYCDKDITVNVQTEELNVVPGATTQNFDGFYGEVTVSGDQDLKPENIKMGVNIFGVDGGFDAVDTRDANATINDIVIGKTAYVNNQKLEGNFEPLDTSDATATKYDIRSGKTAYVNGEKISGIMENAGKVLITPSLHQTVKKDLYQYVESVDVKSIDETVMNEIIPNIIEGKVVGGAAKLSQALTINTKKGCRVICAVMTREPITITEGWNLIHSETTYPYNSTAWYQSLYVYEKIAEGETETVEVVNRISTRIMVGMISYDTTEMPEVVWNKESERTRVGSVLIDIPLQKTDLVITGFMWGGSSDSASLSTNTQYTKYANTSEGASRLTMFSIDSQTASNVSIEFPGANDYNACVVRFPIKTENPLSEENIKAGVKILSLTGNFTADATATATDIAKDKTAYVNGEKIIGVLDAVDTRDADAVASDIVLGKTAYVNNQKITGTLEALDTSIFSEMSNCSNMFQNNKTITNMHISGLTRTVNCNYMFSGCTALTEVVLKDTISVRNLGYMFRDCSNLRTVLISNTDTVTIMASMFFNCKNMQEVPSLNTGNVTNMTSMFSGCTSLTTIPLLNTNKVTTMELMFQNCTSLITIPQFNTSSVQNMTNMFNGCTSLTTIPQFDTSSAIRIESMFTGCTNLTTIPQFDTSSVQLIANMFTGCTKLSDESLNNILAMCINAVKPYSNYKNLKYIGLTQDQATRCQSLSNYQAFLDAGWTTGY